MALAIAAVVPSASGTISVPFPVVVERRGMVAMVATEALFSVAIPARNSKGRLEATLASIARAEIDASRLEVVVADDGSTDGEPAALAGRVWPFRLELVSGAWGSQSAATNAALARCRGQYVLLSAQDILFRPDLFAQHLASHERFPGEEVAVLGDLPYAPDLTVTPFMFYLINGGYQFAYYLIRDPLRVPPNFVYAPHVSLRRSTLDRVGGFDERLPYGCQDTDLGIRLHAAGVRLVFNAEAVGYHNHPITLEEFCVRQRRVALGMVRLQQKHPTHEGGPGLWDLAVRSGLAYAPAQEDHDRAIVERLEPLLDQRPDWASLWQRAFSRNEPLERFGETERGTLRLTDALFNAYHRLLQHHLAEGLLQAAVDEHGQEHAREWIEPRLARLQVPVPTRRLVDRRLRELSLGVLPCGAGDLISTRIVFDLNGYDAAAQWLDAQLQPKAAVFNQEYVLVIDAKKLTDRQRQRLAQLAHVVTRRDAAGLAAALRAAGAEIVVVASADTRFDDALAPVLAQRVFARFPEVVALGGGLAEAPGGPIHYGWRCSASGTERLLRAVGPAGPQPIDATIDELCVLRRATALAALDAGGPLPQEPIVELCRRLRQNHGQILHVPELAAVSVVSRRAACAGK